MITRTVRADTMMQALARVKEELGDDALVVSARQIPGGSPWQVWIKPKVEVVAVRLEAGEESPYAEKKTLSSVTESDKESLEKDMTRKNTTPFKAGMAPGSGARKSTKLEVSVPVTSIQSGNRKIQHSSTSEETETKDVVDLQGMKGVSQPLSNPKIGLLQQLGRDEGAEPVDIVQLSGRGKPAMPALQLPQLPWSTPRVETSKLDGAWPLLEKGHAHLMRQGVDAGLINRVCQISADTLGYQAALNEKKVVEHLRRQLEAYIKVVKESNPQERQVICVVGPSGAGKTSFCAKLAVRYRKVLQRSVAWVSADTVRTGGISEARAYTEAINIPMRAVYTPQELSEAVESFQVKDLVIVDTPACNPRNEESVVQTGALLTALPNRITWLVIPATARENDLLNMVTAVNPFKPKALVATKLDETNSYGAVYNLGLRSQIPFAYFTNGSRVLDDLKPAASARLVQSFFTERFE